MSSHRSHGNIGTEVEHSYSNNEQNCTYRKNGKLRGREIDQRCKVKYKNDRSDGEYRNEGFLQLDHQDLEQNVTAFENGNVSFFGDC